MSPGSLALVIGVPVVALGVAGLLLAMWLRARFRTAAARLTAVLADEPAVRGPERGIYRGSTGGYSNVFGNGRIALTAKRLLFQKGVGGLVEVQLADVVGVRISKTFNRSVVGNRTHLVVQTRIGEVGYFVDDTDGWRAAIERATT
jgi:hypothetical protein